jgi:hypothetical protein
MKYLSETPEFRQWVERRKRESEMHKCLPMRILHAWIDGYRSELYHMLAAPVSLVP